MSEQEWDDLMGAGSYAEAKAAEICCVAKDIAARELGSTSRRLFFSAMHPMHVEYIGIYRHMADATGGSLVA